MWFHEDSKDDSLYIWNWKSNHNYDRGIPLFDIISLINGHMGELIVGDGHFYLL